MAVRFGLQASIVVGGTSYRVLRHALHEQISEVSVLRCAIVSDAAEAPDPASLLDAAAVLTLKTFDEGGKRTFVGKVVRAERTDETVEIEVVPKAWRLSRRADCRIFQKMSAVDIIKKVLDEAGVDTTDWKTSGSYAKRDYTVQYRETDLAFVARLLSEEGIYFAIHHDDSKDTMVFGDDPKGFGPIEGTASLTYREGGSAVGSDYARVSDLVYSQQVRSNKTTIRDYDPTKPKVKLESTSSADKADTEVYVWPGRFTDAKVGDQLAKVLLDSIRADRNILTGETAVLTLVPGARFSVDSHPYASLNQEYLVVAVDMQGTDAPFKAEGGQRRKSDHEGHATCRFRAIPTSVTYRPPRIVREHFVAGSQTALTTGPAGEEIYTDAGGHVKAQFYWDRLGKKDDQSSCWMRSSQLPTGGSMLLPRMKWEVQVTYLEGDVDRPFVMSRMYNKVTPPPYSLPEHKAKSSIQTATTPGGGSSNEIRMSDAKGSEEMFMNASKDMSVGVGNNTTESIGANLTRSIGSNHNLSITDSFTASVGGNQNLTVGAKQDVHVQTFMVDQVTGNHTLTIGGARSMKVGGDHKRDVTGNSDLSVGSLNIDLVVGAANEHAVGNFTNKVSGAIVDMTAGARSITVGGNFNETATLAKVVVVGAGHAVDVSGAMNAKVGGLIYRKISEALEETGASGFTEIAAGAQLLKSGGTISIEADNALTIVMGASILSLTPASVSIVGTSIKLDGEVVDEAALVLDN